MFGPKSILNRHNSNSFIHTQVAQAMCTWIQAGVTELMPGHSHSPIAGNCSAAAAEVDAVGVRAAGDDAEICLGGGKGGSIAIGGRLGRGMSGWAFSFWRIGSCECEKGRVVMMRSSRG